MSIRWDVDRSRIDPQLADDADAVLGTLPDAWAVVQGWRSWAYQNGLWLKCEAGGPQADPPGHSPHEYCDPTTGAPSSQAFDVAHLANGIPTWDVYFASGAPNPVWVRLWAAVKAHPRLHSGHDFPPVAPADDDHIQSVAWWGIRASLRAAGKWPMAAAA